VRINHCIASQAAKEREAKAKADAAEAKRVAAAQAKVYQFRGMISSCFNNYMTKYGKCWVFCSRVGCACARFPSTIADSRVV
jgi:hypothetical protein